MAVTFAEKGEADLFEDADYIDRASLTRSNNTLTGSSLGSCGTSSLRKALARRADGLRPTLVHRLADWHSCIALQSDRFI